VPLITYPQSVDKDDFRGKPDIPNSLSPGTVMSKDPRAGEMSPTMTSWDSSKPPPVQSQLRTWASGALAGSRSGKNSELPKCVSYSKKPSWFMVRHQEWQATRKSPIYTHIPGGRQRAALGMGLLRRRHGFPKGGRRRRGCGGQQPWNLLDTFLPLVARSHPRGRRLLR
jgi:hypothetical protein